MSFDENVARKKSTRWVKASQANYDGDDWSDDDVDSADYYGDEQNRSPRKTVPKLPELPDQYAKSAQDSEKDDDEFSYGTAPTPDFNIKRFQDIDIDADHSANLNELHEVPPAHSSDQPSDEYIKIIQDGDDDDDEDDEYKPQTSSRFQPFPDEYEDEDKDSEPNHSLVTLSNVEQDYKEAEDHSLQGQPNQDYQKSSIEEEKDEQKVEDIPYDSNVPTSIFAPFPSDFDEIVPRDEVEPSDEVVRRDDFEVDQSIPLSNPQVESPGGKTHESLVDSDLNLNQTEDEDEDEEEYIPKTNRFQSEHESISAYGSNHHPQDSSWESPIIIDNESDTEQTEGDQGDDDKNDDEYVPRSNHFQSQLSDDDEDEQLQRESGYDRDGVQGDDEMEEDEQEPLPIDNLNSLSLGEDSPSSRTIHGPIPTIMEPSITTDATTTNEVPQNLKIDAPSTAATLDAPPMSPAPYELSDADTLHIHDPVSSPEASPHLMERDVGHTIHLGETNIRNSHYGEDEFGEHAYLAGLVSTPNPDEYRVEQFQPESSEPEPEPEQTAKPSRESQFYNSVNDYFDDYTDDSGVNKEEEEEQEEQEEEELSLTKTHSSGSLSTGGFSIRSESGNRSSKFSDRTESFTGDRSASFTGDRTASFTNQSISDVGSTRDGGERETHLNPAMSINFGHWRPNTESFRDQFISGTGGTTAPPLPKIDNYSRNSRGEIIEDNASMADSVAFSHLSYTGDELKKEASMVSSSTEENDHTTSMLSVLEDDEENKDGGSEAKDLKDGSTYKTESETMLPVHIPLSPPGNMVTASGQYFHEHLSSSEGTMQHEDKQSNKKDTITERKTPSYNMKQIATVDNPHLRIKKYREAREEEANVFTGLGIWIDQALENVEMASYKSPVTSHVKQAYAEASQFSRKHTNINMGSFLNKRKVLQETSSSAHSIAKGAKGIFSFGKRVIKSEK